MPWPSLDKTKVGAEVFTVPAAVWAVQEVPELVVVYKVAFPEESTAILSPAAERATVRFWVAPETFLFAQDVPVLVVK